MGQPDFTRLCRSADHVRVGELTFRFQRFNASMDQPHAADGRTFVIYKDHRIIGDYASFWAGVPAFAPRRVFEAGIWAGGSVVLWAELLQPDRLVAIDVERRDDIGSVNAANLAEYLRRPDRAERVRLFWETDQGDALRLRAIVRQELGGALDFVIDDASHEHGPTKQMFEALFPLVRPGGWYAIEDWAWDLQPGCWWRGERRPLSQLIEELVRLTGSPHGVVGGLRVTPTTVFLERGGAPLDDAFRVEDYVTAPPEPSPTPSLWQRVRRAAVSRLRLRRRQSR